MSKPDETLAPLTVAAALQRLRARAVEAADGAQIELVDRAIAGNVAARSACIRLWYSKDRCPRSKSLTPPTVTTAPIESSDSD
jgi:hypothetical protein